jgi:hypothetical protein
MKQILTATIKSIAVLLLALVAIHPLLGPTLPWSADGQLHFWRVVELDHCLRNGYFFPRWMPDMAFGYGYPLLNYYAPLSLYLAEGFHLLGLDFTAAFLAALSTSLALGALGTYLWARDAFGESGGLIAAVVYAYAPYMLYNTIWRGNLAESLALGVLPWAFWWLRRLVLEGNNRNLTLAALAFAVLVLSHNITALIAAPLLSSYALLLWLTTRRSRQALGLIIGALAMGLVLSAFFWLPAFFERDVVQTEKLLASYFDFHHNFMRLGELFSPPVPVDVTLMNPAVPRSLGWVALALAALGLVGGWKVGGSRSWKVDSFPASSDSSTSRWEVLGILAGLLLCGFLALPVSEFLWEGLPLLPYTEFPWRLLGLASLMAAWLAGASAEWARRWRPGARVLGVGLTTLATVAFSLTWLYPRYLAPIENPTPAGLIDFERHGGVLGTTSAAEFLSVWVQELPDTTALQAQYQAGGPIQRLATESLPQGATIVSQAWRLIGGDVTVNSPRDWTATLLLFHFPGWRVWIDGNEVAVTPSFPHGLIRFPVPAGEVRIKVRLGPTPWRLVGMALSAVGLIGLTVLVLRSTTFCSAAMARSRERRLGDEAHRDQASKRAPTRLTSTPPFAPTRPEPGSYLAVLLAVGLVFAVKLAYFDAHDSLVRYTGFDGQTVAGVGAPAQINFQGEIRLLGRDPATLAVEAGDTLPLRLYWTSYAPLDEEYSSFLHLIDAQAHRWGQSDNQHPGGYPTVRWRPGEYNQDDHNLAVLPGTPPGTYTLRAGLLAQTTGVGLDVLDERGAPAGTSVAIGTVTVVRPQQPPAVEVLEMVHRLDIRFGDLTLLGTGLDRHQAAPGETLLLTLYWRAEQKMYQGYVVAIEVTDRSGQVVARVTLPPAASIYPTGEWIAGEIVQGQHWLTLPPGLDSGTYSLSLQLLDASHRAGHAAVALGEAGQVNVVAPQRQMTAPPMKKRLDANFADRITLLGYDLEPQLTRLGETMHLTLYWRAEQLMTRSYTVFTHLLDAGSRIVAQHDGLPANWARPTSGWLPGEIIADVHSLALGADVPPGEYLLEVGLYDAGSNVRLPVLSADGQIIEDRVLLAPVSVEP